MRGETTRIAWSDAEREALASRWRDGWSASEIAHHLNKTFFSRRSRNAVIDAVHRMNLATERRAAYEPSAPRPRAAPKPRRVQTRIYQGDPRASPDTKRHDRLVAGAKAAVGHAEQPRRHLFEVTGQARRTFELAAHECRFPVGEATGCDQLHCGARSAEADVYCAAHRALAGGGRIEPKHADRWHPLPKYARS